ncbi:cupin domain-containing protein [Bacillus atrophaeus]|uniref:cupin domain-containing protein n=1 Tax=Bacillus atrophaeus TaxID=1452 RepID=UPI0018F57F1D|nr:cupin domain-containing protein [Bacillus atrophaeus]MBJ7895890.1 cupin domain-containing protein [Bacillus atrophaeus]
MKTDTFFLQDGGSIPNHPALPLVIYKEALKGRLEQAEQIVNQNHWTNSWAGGVFQQHHYHSNTHEVLVVIKGSATIQFGGEEGVSISVQKGDAAVIPAGTGHKNIDSSSDFTVIGAYPDGRQYDLKTGKPGERTEAIERIKRVPLPDRDPITGKREPLLDIWQKA